MIDEVPPVVRLAYAGRRPPHHPPRFGPPPILVSFVYFPNFLRRRHTFRYRSWSLDSGAFTAYQSGTEIRHSDYLDFAHQVLDGDDPPVEVFALDVIGDWKASLANAEEMTRAGIPCIPTFHLGTPWDVLVRLAGEYPKIALGGVAKVKKTQKEAWIAEVFSRVWPCRMHGFGMSGKDILQRFPFHSIDATNWELGPGAFGLWAAFDGAQLSSRGTDQDLRSEVGFYQEMEATGRRRWAGEFRRQGWIT